VCAGQSASRCGRYPHVLVGAAIIEEPSATVPDQSLDEHNVWHLSGLFPVEHRLKDWLLGASKDFHRIILIEYYPSGSIHIVIVCSVVDQENSILRDHRSRSRLYDLRVERFRESTQWPSESTDGRHRPDSTSSIYRVFFLERSLRIWSIQHSTSLYRQ